jgi:hypothetical protein
MRNSTLFIIGLALTLFTGCASTLEDTNAQQQEKESGWIGADTYEVGGLVYGSVTHSLLGEWRDIADDETLQTRLVDLQLKFLKTAAESRGWRFNQLAESVAITDMQLSGDKVTIEYTAVIDMLGRLNGDVPKLEALDPLVFTAFVPVVPEGFSSDEMAGCAESDGSHSIRSYNFHYYFAPEKSECGIALTEATLEITEVFDRPRTYPEYDRLLQELPGDKTGFRAALVPNRGDNDPMSRFDAHAEMLEDDLGLEGTDQPDGFRRYEWKQNGATMIIDLYDPTQVGWGSGFETSFRERLKDYTLVHYNGHSSYGSKHLLDDPDAFSPDYQIIIMHSCQSYAYYTRQVFRAKVGPNDPQGFDGADIIATGKSSYPSGAPKTLNVLLGSLMQGMDNVLNGAPENAPDWITIAEKIKASTWGDILYGLAGVRDNSWTP